MKKISNKCLLALVAVPFFSMCAKTNEVAQKEQVTITANIEDTKVSLTQGEEKLVLSWEEGDAINVIGETTEEFTIKDGFTAKSAKFTGNEVTGSSFDIVYPSDYATKDAITARSYTGQVQNGNGSTAHLEYNAIIEGAADYQEISFAKGATGVKMNGALKLVVKLPDDVTAVSSLKLTAPSAIFYTTNGDGATTKSESLSMTFTNTAIGDDHTLTAYMMTSWQDVTIPANTKLTLDVTAPEQNSYYSKTFYCTTEQTISGGATFVIDISSATLDYTLKGSGTETDPYLLYTVQDMEAMKGLLDADKQTFFKMMADIDMAGLDWKSLNGAGTFDKKIDFDGAGHTLFNFTTTATTEYPSFFGVLYGRCANVNFVNANITTTANGVGIIGGYGGTSGKPCVVENVHVQGKIDAYDESADSGGGNVGGLFGIVRECTINRCSADVEITSFGKNAGGIFALDKGVATVSNCWTAGSIWNKSSICGGIAGEIAIENNSIYNCFSTMAITSQFYYGGIVGRALGNTSTKASKANVENITPNIHIEKCIAWSDSLRSNCADASEHYSNGTIIATTARKNYLVDCVRKADFNWGDCAGNALRGGYLPFDQENADPDHPLVQGEGTYATAYHGKAAAAGKTLSAVAKDLGWSTDIWDLNGDYPTLKNNPEPEL